MSINIENLCAGFAGKVTIASDPPGEDEEPLELFLVNGNQPSRRHVARIGSQNVAITHEDLLKLLKELERIYRD